MQNLRRLGYGLAGLILLLLIIFGFVGVPKPGAIKTEGVPRLSWGTLDDVYEQGVPVLTGKQNLVGWDPATGGLISTAVKGSKLQLVLRDKPNGDTKALGELPLTARGFLVPSKDLGFLVYNLDHDGDEQFQVYRFDFATKQSTLLTDGKSRNRIGSLSIDGKLLSYTSNADSKTATSLYVVDPKDPKSARKVFQGPGTWSPGDISADNQKMLIWKTITGGARFGALYVLDLASGQAEPLVANADTSVRQGAAVWHPSGKAVLYASDQGSEFRTLRLRTLSTGAEVKIFPDLVYDTDELRIAPGGDWVAISTNEDGVHKLSLYQMPTELNEKAATSSLKRGIHESPASELDQVAFHPAKPIVAWRQTPLRGVPTLVSLPITGSETITWDAPELPKVLTGLDEPSLVRYETFDKDKETGKAREISAWIFRPGRRFQTARPVVIDLHGGPSGQAAVLPDMTTALLNWKGITVIRPNFRGSTAYGKTFETLDNKKLRQDAVKDIGALLDWMKDRPDFNLQRVCVSGGSYGGYLSLAVAAEYSSRLKCGVDLFGIANFPKLIASTDADLRDYARQEFGDEQDPAMLEYLESISPTEQAVKIKIPYFIYQGLNDPRVPVAQSQRMADKLRVPGREVWYLQADNEGHGLTNPWNRLYVWTAQLSFLEKYLLGQ